MAYIKARSKIAMGAASGVRAVCGAALVQSRSAHRANRMLGKLVFVRMRQGGAAFSGRRPVKDKTHGNVRNAA